MGSTRLRPAIPTMSIGQSAAGHRLPDKLRIIKEAGFEGVEIFYACLEAYAKEFTSITADRDQLREAAKQTGALCKELALFVINLQPCMNYDGILDPKEHAERVEEITFRMELCHLLGTDMLQIPATFRTDAGVSGDEAKTVSDLRELADIGLKQSPQIRMSWESLCWSTYCPTWQSCYNIVAKVDRPNFGIVLDSFHIAGYEYADPGVEGCTRPDGAERLKKSIAEIPSTVDLNKLFYVQIVDAEKLPVPVVEGQSPYYVEGQPARMSWSRNCRLFPYETQHGAFMPAEETAKAIFSTGFSGWVSLELFHRQTTDSDPNTPRELAERGMQSWLKMKERLNLQ